MTTLFTKIADFLRLCRPRQWYKNLLVFLALFFSGNLFNVPLLLISAWAFLALVLISSANYAINDIIDAKQDLHFAEKKNRPVASGRIKKWEAGAFASVLAAASFCLSFLINYYFFLAVLAIFILTLLYSLALKRIFIIDIAAISSNFVLRAVAGALVIGVYASSWLVAGIFLFAFFLVAGKRYGERVLLGKKAGMHRAVLKYYTERISKILLFVFAFLLSACFALFAWLEHRNLLYALPLFIFLVARYLWVAILDPKIAANPERAFSDWLMVLASAMFIIIAIVLMYL